MSPGLILHRSNIGLSMRSICTFLFSIYIHHKLYQRKNLNIIIVWQTVTSTKSICLCMCVCMFVLMFVSVCFSVSLCRSCFLAYISETLRQSQSGNMIFTENYEEKYKQLAPTLAELVPPRRCSR